MKQQESQNLLNPWDAAGMREIFARTSTVVPSLLGLSFRSEVLSRQ